MKYKSACKDCGVIVYYDKDDVKHNYYCPRCNGLIYAPGERFLYVIIMAIAALVSFIPVLFLPILTLDMANQVVSTTLLSVVSTFFSDGNAVVATIIFLTGIAIPLSMLGLLLVILIPLHLTKRIANVHIYYRLYSTIKHWGMAEVYMISVLVSVIKLQTMGDLSIDAGFFIFIFFLICFYLTVIWFNPDDIWHLHHV
jgi:paraquat-inducible protein A